MTVRELRPGRASGRVRAPPSKSYTHRALVAGYLTGARYRIDAPLDSDDTRATATAIVRLGGTVERRRRHWTVRPGRGAEGSARHIDCGESGTTLRFAAALAARDSTTTVLDGRGRLAARPMGQLLSTLVELGARCDRPAGPTQFPIVVEGPIHGGSVRLDASMSSQFASALLLVLPTVSGGSVLRLTGRVVSEPYIDATLAVLKFHRVGIERSGRLFRIAGGTRFRGSRFRVPGDASSAAYLWTAGAITGGRVRVEGIPTDWPQADLAVLDLLRRAGAIVRRDRHGASVEGPVERGFEVDLTASPDLYPLAAVIASAIPETSRIRGAPHVAFKESDRRAGAIRLARATGARVRTTPRSLTIRGRVRPRPFRLPDLDDHRMVMSAAVGALVAEGPCRVGDARAVEKSFPAFWNALDTLAAEAPA